MNSQDKPKLTVSPESEITLSMLMEYNFSMHAFNCMIADKHECISCGWQDNTHIHKDMIHRRYEAYNMTTKFTVTNECTMCDNQWITPEKLDWYTRRSIKFMAQEYEKDNYVDRELFPSIIRMYEAAYEYKMILDPRESKSCDVEVPVI